jgi:5-methylcytosine-specific restriction protein A
MAAYLFVWNPKLWHCDSNDLSDELVAVPGGEGWDHACANRAAQPGDRAFLIRLGREPRGIVGSGTVTSEVFNRPHWDLEKRRQGIQSPGVWIRWDTLLVAGRDAILPIADLKRGTLGKMHWSSQKSGVTIPPIVVPALEKAWASLVGRKLEQQVAGAYRAWEGLVTESRVPKRKRDRRLRELAMAGANGVCAACGTDFSAVLGGFGTSVLQAHHHQQVALYDQPVLNGVADLAVVCANCHRLIHHDVQNAMSVADLRKKLARDA